jgi:hypothetical protein
MRKRVESFWGTLGAGRRFDFVTEYATKLPAMAITLLFDSQPHFLPQHPREERAAHNHTSQAVRASSQDGRLLEAVAEHARDILGSGRGR